MTNLPDASRSTSRSQFRLLVLAPVLLFALTMVATQAAQAQTFNILYAFTGGYGSPAGFYPTSGLIFDHAGNLYGTYETNIYFTGAIYQLARQGSNWGLKALFVFPGGTQGSVPEGGLIFGPDGAIYGSTFQGGGNCDGVLNYCGTVYRLAPSSGCRNAYCSWNETVQYVFGTTNINEDGYSPRTGVTFDSTGNIYGTTYLGGIYNCGTAYQLYRTQNGWEEKDLYDFPRSSLGHPTSGFTLDAAGNLYGTAQGEFDFGTVYELVHSAQGWSEQVIYSFQGGNDGANPEGGLIFDAAGNAYGTTYGVYGDGQPGTVYELSPQSDGTWRETVLYTFPSGINGPDSTLAMDAPGNLYGTTPGTPGNNPDRWGMVFKLSPVNGSWTFTQLHQFTSGEDGWNPSGVILDAAGNLYGTSLYGGPYDWGLIWEITP